MDTLWVRFAKDSSLPARMDENSRQRFEALFDTSVKNSAWMIALDLLRLKAKNTPMIQWVGNAPYINWSETVRSISNGAMTPKPFAQSFIYKTRSGPFKIWSMVRAQWNISQYIMARFEKNWKPPAEIIMQIAESTALGLALLSLTMRLPKHTSQQMAEWLAHPEKLNPAQRQAVLQIQRLQSLRNELRHAWVILFPDLHPDAIPDTGPDYFWNKPPVIQVGQQEPAQAQNANEWKGTGVAGKRVTGRVKLIATPNDGVSALSSTQPYVLVFPLAKPDTVMLFSKATAVLYGTGGALSHACTIAREQNIPCITGLGNGFIARIKQLLGEQKEVWLDIDPTSSSVTLIRSA